ncbi:PAS domain S-box protein [Methylobacterium sp. WL69]|uniref:PAS domain S-box protein n=1 Tax=Methylobacterium sp. WL69 TaxID=2603893 RepID=UPI0011C81183|nr:PAS domain S-box protein [Methylobacterium sp. WL69]TXM78010.1 PAS domain S-box protein [Methylobacterium sp. WL69]
MADFFSGRPRPAVAPWGAGLAGLVVLILGGWQIARRIAPAGAEAWALDTAIPAGLVGVAVCALVGLALALDRRRRSLAAEGALFLGLFEATSDPQILVRVAADGSLRIVRANAAARLAAALPPDRPFAEEIPPGEAQAMRPHLAEAVATGQPVRVEGQSLPLFGLGGADVLYVPVRGTGAPTLVCVTLHDLARLRGAEAEARDATRLLAMAEQVAHVGHWHVSLATDAVIWSDEVYRIHGLDPAHFTPTLATGIRAYHPDDRARVEECITAAIRDRTGFEIRLRIVRPDGDVRDVFARGIYQAAGAEGGDSLFGVFADLTDRKQVERALADKSALLEATLESIDQGLMLIAADGTVPVANHRAIEILRLPPGMIGQRPDYRAVRRHCRATGAWGVLIQDPAHWHLDGERRTTDLRSERRRDDGSVIEIRSLPILDGKGHGKGYVQTLTDITDRRLAETRLRDSEARYRLLADHTSDLILLDDPNGRHLYISPAITPMLGYSLDEANAAGLRTLVHPEDIANLSATLHALAPARPTGSAVYRLRHKDGSDIWVEAAFRRIEEHGNVQIIHAIRDVTERQRQELDLERAKVAAEAGARVKAEFLANMSHELRTPLTGMLGVHDLLMGDAALSVSQKRLLGLAQESGRSLLTIVNDILDFSKIEAGQLAVESLPFGLRALLEGCRELSVEAARGRAVTVSVEVAPDMPDWFIGDPTRLRQVVLNLATNAIKFTTDGGVTLRARCSGAGAVPLVTIEVVDTGIGIAPDALPHLFERFAQADGSISRQYGGTGLGLAISRRLVRLMRGEIGATSRIGEGSTFWFTLPLPLAQATEGGAGRTALTAPAPLARRLLLAEDNPINQEIIGTVLRQKGHAVTVVGDGERAVSAVATEPAFDLVLMDVQMPGQDGLSATRAIRQAEADEGRRRLPIVALTANAMAEEIARCRAAGMDAHVAKPVDWTLLFAAIDGLLSRAGDARP